jgi:hypothetical protein
MYVVIQSIYGGWHVINKDTEAVQSCWYDQIMAHQVARDLNKRK